MPFRNIMDDGPPEDFLAEDAAYPPQEAPLLTMEDIKGFLKVTALFEQEMIEATGLPPGNPLQYHLLMLLRVRPEWIEMARKQARDEMHRWKEGQDE